VRQDTPNFKRPSSFSTLKKAQHGVISQLPNQSKSVSHCWLYHISHYVHEKKIYYIATLLSPYNARFVLPYHLSRSNATTCKAPFISHDNLACWSPIEVPSKSHGFAPWALVFFVSGVVSTSSQAFRSGAATVAEEVDVQVFWQRGAGLRFWAWQLIYYYYYYHYYYYIVWLHND